MRRPALTAAALFAAIALVALGYRIGRRATPPAGHPAPATPSGGAPPARRILYWYDPMAPEQHFAHPGLSPMGMQMVPKYASRAAGSPGVRIDPRMVENLGIRTAIVERRALPAGVRVPASVSWNLDDAYTISARADGIVTRLDVRAPYTRVAAGQPLAALLAPAWGGALAEYAALLHTRSSDARALRVAARERLRVLGLSDRDIRDAIRGRGPGSAVAVRAPEAGVVVTVDVREGQRVDAGQTLMTLNGLGTVWLLAAIPQDAIGGIGAGTPAEARVDAFPGRIFHGSVEALLPEVDPVTRTQRARIVLANPERMLAPGMFATVSLRPAPGPALPLVPTGAIIATGAATRVILATGNGHFEPVPVVLGRSAGGYTEVLRGLRGGERIVVSGQFLIDSEASLSGALGRL